MFPQVSDIIIIIIIRQFNLTQSQFHIVTESSSCFYSWLSSFALCASECNCIMPLCADWKSLEQMCGLQWVTGCDYNPLF